MAVIEGTLDIWNTQNPDTLFKAQKSAMKFCVSQPFSFTFLHAPFTHLRGSGGVENLPSATKMEFVMLATGDGRLYALSCELIPFVAFPDFLVLLVLSWML